ncbi:MAG: metal-dependent phosphohydrolase, partial [Gammaproteobacteria bacterium]
HQDYSVLDDSATDDGVRSLIALSLLAESAIAQYQGQPSSLEWHKGGARASNYLGLTDDEVGDLLDGLHDSFHTEH